MTTWAFTDDIGDALAPFLRSRSTAPRLLGLGEPMHGVEEFLRLRNAAFRHLVEHAGCRSVAIESDCLAALDVDAFVTDGTGRLDDVLATGFSHGFGAAAGNRELVDWMHGYNRGRAEPDRVRFYGCDAPLEMSGTPSPGPALMALHRYLADALDPARLPAAGDIDRLVGDPARWTDPAGLMDPARSVGNDAAVAELRLITDDLMAVLHATSPGLIAATSGDGWWRAELHGRTAAGLLRYHAATADRSDARFERLMGLRNTMMAANLHAILAREARRGPTMAFAHNGLLQRDRSVWRPAWPGYEGLCLEWASAGAIVATQLGDEYAFLATAVGSIPDRGLDAPAPDTLEGALSALPERRYLLDGRHLATLAADATSRTDTSADQSYIALDAARVDGTDAVVFLRDIRPS